MATSSARTVCVSAAWVRAACALAALAVQLAPSVAHADEGMPTATHAERERERGAADEPQVESFELRIGWFDQRGHGYQSQEGLDGNPGSEDAIIFQPMALFRIRSSPNVRHTVTIPVDVVSAASPDALDAITSASRVNESASVDIASTIDHGVDTLALHFAAGFEEPLRTGSYGAAWTRRLAEDNATLTLSGNATFDYFDNIREDGITDEQRSRVAVNANLGGSQILSPTTLVDGSYGLTYQVGVLEQTWNAVPRGRYLTPLGEKLPHERLRHALAGRISQHLPGIATTLKLAYRFYADDFGLVAHTVELRAYQYLTRWLVVRGTWRFHRQRAVDFYTEDARMLEPRPLLPRTADSDLARFDAHELGVKLMVLPRRARWAWLRPHSFALSYDRYTRSNDLTMDVFALEWGRSF